MKTTIPKKLIDQSVAESKENNCNVVISLNHKGDNLQSLPWYMYQHWNNQRPVIALLHYKNGREIKDNNYKFEETPSAEHWRNNKIKALDQVETPSNEKDPLNDDNTGWHKRFRIMKIRYNLDNYKIAEITGNTYESVRTTTQPNKSFPRNLKLAVWLSEQH